MNDATREVVDPNKQAIQSEIDQKRAAIDQKNAEINDITKDLEKLQQENQKNTKDLLDQFQLKITEYKKEIETLQAEIAKLQASLKEASSIMRNGANKIDAVLTSSLSPETKKDENPETPTQTSPDTPSQNTSQSTTSTPNTQTTSKTQSTQEASSSTQTAPEVSSQEALKTEETSKPETASQAPSDAQNNRQETPQVASVAPVAQVEKPQTPETQVQSQTPTETQPASQVETQPQLTDAQKLAQVQQILGKLESKFISLQAESNSITLTASDLASLDQASNLLQQGPVSQSTADQRDLLINDEDARKDYIKELKEQIKAEKKASKDLKKIRDLQEKLAQVSNHNNYNLNVMNSLSGINSVLQNGTYLDTKFQIPREQKFALELIKKRDLLRSWAVVPLTIDGRTVEVYNGAFVGQALQTWLRIDNCNQPVNIVEKLLVDHTKMSLDQARSATKTITTIGVLAGAFYGLKWLLGNTDKEGNRSFGLSPKKFLGAAVVLLGGNMASQMATGRGALDLINEFWRTGNNPFTSETYEKAQPIEQISLDQTALQMALLGVPYAQLSQFTSPKSWPISSIDLVSLQRYYEAQMLIAKQNQLNDKIQQIGAQISAIKDIINNPNATQLLNQNLANMNIQAQELANLENAGLTLDELLYQNSNNRKILETYMETNNLMIAPGKKDEIMKKIITTKDKLTDEVIQKLQQEGLLIAKMPENPEIQKLTISADAKQKLESAFRTFADRAEFRNIQLSAIDGEKIKLKSDSSEVIFDAKTLRIPWLVNSAGQEIQMQNHEELMHAALFINQTKDKLRKKTPDLTKKWEHDWPFAEPSGRENLKGREGIVFKGAIATESVLDSSLPWIAEMNKYPTIENGDNRQFLINYLNTQWKKDHPTVAWKTNPQAK